MDVPFPFIVCYPRSGSTLLRLMLDAHPDLAIPAETHFRKVFGGENAEGVVSVQKRDAICRELVKSPRWNDFNLTADEFRRRLDRVPLGAPAAEALLAFWRLYSEKRAKPRWGDKTPGHLKCVTKIANIFPQARFIHIVRDGRDVAASMRETWFASGRTIADLASDWTDRIADFLTDAERSGLAVHTLRYEDMVANPTEALKGVCAFIALPYCEAMLAYHQNAEERLSELSNLRSKSGVVEGSARRADHFLTSEPPTIDRIGRWREVWPGREVAEFEAIAGTMLTTLGYALSS